MHPLGHAQRVLIPRLRAGYFAKGTLRTGRRGRLVASREDERGSCSKVLSSLQRRAVWRSRRAASGGSRMRAREMDFAHQIHCLLYIFFVLPGYIRQQGDGAPKYTTGFTAEEYEDCGGGGTVGSSGQAERQGEIEGRKLEMESKKFEKESKMMDAYNNLISQDTVTDDEKAERVAAMKCLRKMLFPEII